jgi:hypothetical protein
MPIMPPKKNVPLSSPRKLPTWFMTPALKICLESKCKKEQKQLKKNKYVIEKKKGFTNYLDSRNGIRRRFDRREYDTKKREVEFGKAYTKYMKERTKIKLKIFKEKEHNDLLNCQLKKCYNDILNTLKIRVESILAHTNKNTEEYKLASKYNKLLTQMGKTNKLTGEDIKRFDIDLVKIILKEHIGKQYW